MTDEARPRPFTDREMEMAAPTIHALREKVRSLDEAINVAVLIAKVVVEREAREKVIGELPWR